MGDQKYKTSEYVKKRKKLTGMLFEIALPNEYLVEVGRKSVKPVLGGKRLRLFKKFIRVPASVQTLYFSTDNANIDYQGIGIDGYANWRIDPQSPDVAIKTLDFFDENDPMERTNDELKTICVEAVRHVISNMSIDDALKKKDEIAERLKLQLKEIEGKWGILFDQVGIAKVRIMSDKLFQDLQSKFRNSLRLEVEKKKLETDREIAHEQNEMHEKTETEKLETARRLDITKVEGESSVKAMSLDEKYKLDLKSREMEEETYRKDASFKAEKENKEHELAKLSKELETRLLEIEREVASKQKLLEEVKNEIARAQLAIEALRRANEQTFSGEILTSKFIEQLPGIFEAVKIDNYTVLAGGNGTVSPVTSFLSELFTLLKTADVKELFGKREEKTGTKE